MSEEEPPPARPKLILPAAANQAPKSQLLVPSAPDVLPAEVSPVVSNEGSAEPVAGTEAPAVGTGVVKITAMVPPSVAEVEEEVVEEVVHQEPEPAVEYAEPAIEYIEPAVPEVHQAPLVYQQPPVPQLETPAYPPPTMAPPQPQPGYQQPVGYVPAVVPPVQLGAQTKSIPSWALFFFGLLGGFLITLALFKFTALAEGLRPDLVERGRQLAKTALQSSDNETPADE